ncbi:MAG: hypothetical protein P4M05_27855 [Bradyrhizobium sp.]|nr:hypothetical protein [Bradyrhizobium sp.]
MNVKMFNIVKQVLVEAGDAEPITFLIYIISSNKKFHLRAFRMGMFRMTPFGSETPHVSDEDVFTVDVMLFDNNKSFDSLSEAEEFIKERIQYQLQP